MTIGKVFTLKYPTLPVLEPKKNTSFEAMYYPLGKVRFKLRVPIYWQDDSLNILGGLLLDEAKIYPLKKYT